jgi:transcription antitermination protein NusB
MAAGKRRTAREMAIQMLYQSDLGASPLPQIFNSFDLSEYIAQETARERDKKAPEDTEVPSLAAHPGAPLTQHAQNMQDAQLAQTAQTAQNAQRAAPPPRAAGALAEPAPVAGPAGKSDRAEYARRRRRVEEAFQYAQALVHGTVDHREEIDGLIRGQADNWRLERMPAVDRNILRLAVFEMLYEVDIPKLVVVDEAIELAKKFGSEQSGRFVNGLLDGLLKQHTFPGTLT